MEKFTFECEHPYMILKKKINWQIEKEMDKLDCFKLELFFSNYFTEEMKM